MRYSKKERDNRKKVLAFAGLFVLSLSLLYYMPNQEFSVLESETLETVNYTTDYPEIYAGTDSGSIYHIRPGEDPVKKADLNNEISSLHFTNARGLITSGTEITDSTTSIFEFGEKKDVKFEGLVNDATTDGNILYIAHHGKSHHHGGGNAHTSHSTGNIGNGFVGIYDLRNDKMIDQIPLESAYRLDKVKNEVLAMGAAGEVVQIDLESRKVSHRIKLGTWIGGIDNEEEGFLSTYRRKIIETPENDNLKPVEVEHGYLGEFYQNGSEKNVKDFGISSLPHSVERYNETLVLVTDISRGKLIFVDFERNKSEELSLGKHPMSLIIRDKFAYIADSETDKMYRVNVETRELVDFVNLPKISAIGEPPAKPVEWSIDTS